jgi:hypothetical protein
MGIAAAVGVGTAVAGIGGALISSSASKSAANAQAQAANSAAELQSQAANHAAELQSQAANNATLAAQQEAAQTRSDLSPFRRSGEAATNALMSSLGLSGGSGINFLKANGLPGLTFQPTQAQLEATPGYQFNLAQGQQAVANSNAAQGRGISGAALKGAANYATGLANNTLLTQQGIFQQNLNNVLNPLQSLSNLGENAAAQTGALGTQNVNSANQALIGGANAAAAGQIGAANAGAAGQIGAANAGAAGTVGSANAAAGALSGLGSAPLNYQLYSQLLNGGGGGNGYGTNGSFYGNTDAAALSAAGSAATGNNYVGNNGLGGQY